MEQYSDIELLALLVAGEADGEPLEGQVAVACVPVERLRRKRWGATLRGVILQPYQFSTFDSEHWRRFTTRIDSKRVLARLAVERLLNSPADGATHYHAAGSIPPWARSNRMEMIGQLAGHIFYREE